jgi:hypothetical protein
MKMNVLSIALAAATLSLALTSTDAAAARCQAEYDEMEFAASEALDACQDGSDEGYCIFAWGYFEGRARAYEDCMRKDSQGAQ